MDTRFLKALHISTISEFFILKLYYHILIFGPDLFANLKMVEDWSEFLQMQEDDINYKRMVWKKRMGKWEIKSVNIEEKAKFRKIL